MDDRLAIPNNLRKSILKTLHSAYQGVSSMKSRANAATISEMYDTHAIFVMK